MLIKNVALVVPEVNNVKDIWLYSALNSNGDEVELLELSMKFSPSEICHIHLYINLFVKVKVKGHYSAVRQRLTINRVVGSISTQGYRLLSFVRSGK